MNGGIPTSGLSERFLACPYLSIILEKGTTQRWHAHRGTTGSGHLYQGRFKSFPIQQDEHYYSVARYVERNAQRASLCRRAEAWPYGSLHRWLRGAAEDKRLLSAWPLPRKPSWSDHVN